MRQEMQANIASQTQGVTVQLGQLSQSVMQQLGQVRQELQKGVADSGKLAMDAQREVANRLQSSTDTLRQLSQQVGEVQKMGQDLSQATQTMQSILAARNRAEFSARQRSKNCWRMRCRAPRTRCSTASAPTNASMPIVHIEDRILCIDSKFPLDAYRRFLESGEDSSPRISRSPCESMRTPLAKNIFCPMSTRSITR